MEREGNIDRAYVIIVASTYLLNFSDSTKHALLSPPTRQTSQSSASWQVEQINPMVKKYAYTYILTMTAPFWTEGGGRFPHKSIVGNRD